MIRSLREVGLVLVWVCSALLLVAAQFDYMLSPIKMQTTIAGVIVGSVLLVYDTVIRPKSEPVDVWAVQRHVMRTSGQLVPYLPEVNNGSVLYAALTLEELSETIKALVRVLSRDDSGRTQQEARLLTRLKVAAIEAEQNSKEIRGALSQVPQFSLALDLDEAVELLDGVSDTTVTIAGLCAASGLPGTEGYTEVQHSNQSKVNPETGVIDKDPSGKWIKGRNFVKPDLMDVLHHCSTHDYRSQIITRT